MPFRPPDVVSFSPVSAVRPGVPLGVEGAMMTTDEVSRLFPALHLDSDELFSALDGRALETHRGEWQIQVQSIYDDAGHRWLQLGLEGSPPYSMTLHVSTTDDAAHVIQAVSSWLDSSPDSGMVM